MTPDLSRTPSLRVLPIITAAVLLAHLAFLGGSSMTLGRNTGLTPPPSGRVFNTRTIALAPPPLTSAAERPLTPLVTAHRENKKPATTGSQKPAPAEMAPPGRNSDVQPSAADEAAATSGIDKAAATQIGLSANENPSDIDQQPDDPRPPRAQLAAPGAVVLPDSVRLKYKVESNKFPFGANAELRWQWSGAHYEARLELSAYGLARVQSSRGQITPGGLAPLRFSDKYRSEVAAHFNREKGKVTFSANTPDIPLLAGAQDRLSVLVQVGAMIAGDPARYKEGSTFAIQTIGPRDADTWQFTVGNRETLALPGGQQATLKMVRNPREEFDQKVELWLAPALGYLPARVRITEPNGDLVDQKWAATES